MRHRLHGSLDPHFALAYAAIGNVCAQTHYNVRQVGDSRERSRVFADASLDALWFDNGSAPELDYALKPSVGQSFRTSQ